MPRRRRASRRRQRSLGQRLCRYLGWRLALLAVVVMAIGIAVASVDLGAYRTRAESMASSALGMEVTIAGPMGIGLLPAPHVSVGDVQVSGRGATLARIARARVYVHPAGLLHGELRIERIALADARIHVEQDHSGRLNVAPPTGGGGVPVIGIAQASLSYVDRRTGASLEATGCSLDLSRLRTGDARPAAGLALDARLQCRAVRRGSVTLSGLDIVASGEDGVIVAEPISARLFGGRGRGRLRADLTAGTPRFDLEYELEAFRLQRFLATLASAPAADGRMDFQAALAARGSSVAALERSADGRLSLRGSGLTLHGQDIDARLEEYRETQHFDLLDTGAVLLAGPAGLAVTKGYDFAGLLKGSGGTTPIRRVVSHWRVRDGVASARDVALATADNRIAARGRLDFVDERFEEFRVAVVDSRGCAVVEQGIEGTFANPRVERPGVVASVVAPVVNLFKQGIEKVSDRDCAVFYDGAVAHP